MAQDWAEDAVPVQYFHQGRLYSGLVVAQRHDKATGECWLRFIGELAEEAEKVDEAFALN